MDYGASKDRLHLLQPPRRVGGGLAGVRARIHSRREVCSPQRREDGVCPPLITRKNKVVIWSFLTKAVSEAQNEDESVQTSATSRVWAS